MGPEPTQRLHAADDAFPYNDRKKHATLVREIAEETGLDVSVERLVGIYAQRRERDLVFVFTASPVDRELRTSLERDRVEFVAPRDLPKGTSDRDRERISDALAEGGGTILAVQPSDGEEPPDGTR